jgi:hypothetical protein
MDRPDEQRQRIPDPGDPPVTRPGLAGHNGDETDPENGAEVRVLGGTAVGSGLAGAAVAGATAGPPRDQPGDESGADALDKRGA